MALTFYYTHYSYYLGTWVLLLVIPTMQYLVSERKERGGKDKKTVGCLWRFNLLCDFLLFVLDITR